MSQATSSIAPGFRIKWTDRPELIAVVEAAMLDLEAGIAEDPPGSNIIPGDPYRVHAVPWCAAAVSTWYGRLPGGSPFPWTASTIKLREWGEENKRILVADEPLRMGDVFLMFDAPAGSPHPSRHTGLIVSDPFDSTGIVFCIEGNHANRVAGTARNRSAFTVVLRPVPIS